MRPHGDLNPDEAAEAVFYIAGYRNPAEKGGGNEAGNPPYSRS
jgi:hypothetical protein